MESSEKRPVKRIAVLGANGQIGQVITTHLHKEYPLAQILPCVRSNKANVRHNLNLKYFNFDPFADDWQLLGKVDILINCIGIIAETKEMSFEKAHDGLTQHILAHRDLLGSPRIIQISALGASISSPHPFLHTKGKADSRLLKEKDTIVVRPSIVCTPDTMFLQKLKLLRSLSRQFLHILPFPGHLLATKIQPVLVEDVAEIVARLCTAKNPAPIIYAVGPTTIALQEFICLASPETRILPVAKPLFDTFFRIAGPLLSGLINPAQYQLLASDNTADGREMERLLGRKPHSTTDFWINELNL